MALIVKNGSVFLGDRFERKDILINDLGRIEEIGINLRGEESYNASDLFVFPGFIDPHVHLREPGATYKEDFISGSKAAIAGGITTVMDMPNNKIPTITKSRLDEKKKLAKKALCDIIFHFGATETNFEEVKKADPPSLKIYLGKTTGDLILNSKEALEKHFSTFDKDKIIVLHAADDTGDEKSDLKTTLDNISLSVSLAQKHDRKIHLAHASTREEIMLTKKFKKVTNEVTPHHLFLSKKDVEKLGAFAKVNPPLRSVSQRLALWHMLENFDCIATDHAPHTIEDKEEGAAGFTGLETSFGLMMDAVNQGLIDKIWLGQRMSTNCARIFGLSDRGSIEKGKLGDLTMINPKKEWTVDYTELFTKCKWTPFDGRKLRGKVYCVIKKGNLIFEENNFLI